MVKKLDVITNTAVTYLSDNIKWKNLPVKMTISFPFPYHFSAISGQKIPPGKLQDFYIYWKISGTLLQASGRSPTWLAPPYGYAYLISFKF